MIINTDCLNLSLHRRDRKNGGLLYEEINGVLHKKCVRCKTMKPLTTDNYSTSNTTKRGKRIISVCKSCTKRTRKKVIHINNEGNIVCSCCKLYLSPDNFHNSNDERNKIREYKDIYCKNCSTFKKRQLWKNSEPNIKLFIYKIWEAAQSRTFNAKSSGAKDKEFNITRDYLEKLYENQNGACALTGVEMTYIHNKGKIFTNMSLDRIDSKLGYIESNVQFVCVIVNLMKNTLTVDELKNWCKLILEHKQNSIR